VAVGSVLRVADQLAGRRISLVFATSTGGVGRHVRSLAAGLHARGADVRVHGAGDADELFGFSTSGTQFVPVDIARERSPRRDVVAVRTLRRAIAGSDLVHAHGLRASAIAAAAAPRSLPLVSTWHNAVLGSLLRRRVYANVERRIARRADVVLGASSDLVARAVAFGARDARLGPVAAPVLPPPAREPASVRAELGADERPLVVAVSRLSPQKRIDVLIDAAVVLADRDPAPLVVVAGGWGPAQSALEAQIASTGAPVRLLGRRDDIADLLNAADVVALSSDWEARALVAQEALRLGRPLVATAVGGVPELVGDAALLVPPGDPRSFAAAVGSLLDDAERADTLGAAGRRQAQTWPDEAASIDAVVDAYLDALGGRS
jgi:glycosyltransferase involved in cell wall biosynthesis